MSLRVYRIEVARWPTPDGRPWARFYGPQAYQVENQALPAWLADLVEKATTWEATQSLKGASSAERFLTSYPPYELQVVLNRIRMDTNVFQPDRNQFVGIVLPPTQRKHYFSGATAMRLANEMRAFGADANVRSSRVVEWKDEPVWPSA